MITKEGGNLFTARFLSGLPESKYSIITLDDQDIARTAELLLKYADTRVDFVDATIIALAERLNITRILTVDRRDFEIVRPRHAPAFELLP